MSPMLQPTANVAHPERVRTAPALAKGAPKPPNAVRKHSEWARDAAVCRRALRLADIDDQKEAADLLGMSKSQLSEQLAGRERPQVERFKSSERLYPYWMSAEMEALTKQQPDLYEMVMTFRMRRSG